MKLTKKYRIVYIGSKMLFPLESFGQGVTYVQDGMNGAEFDTREEAEAFVKNKKLTYEYPKED